MPDEELKLPQMPKIKIWNILIYALIFAIISAGGKLVHLMTDYYFFQEIGFASFFTKSLLTKISLGFSTGLIVGLILFVNYWIAKKISAKPVIFIEPDAGVSSPLPFPQMAGLKSLFQNLLFFLIFIVAFFTGNWAAGHWETILKFVHGVPFNAPDPIFHRDISFYLFTYPFYQFLFNSFFISILFSLLIVGGLYFLNSHILLTERGFKIADDSKTHLAVLLGFLFLTIAVYFHIKMFGLLAAQRAIAPGPGYTDVNVYIPALKILRFIAILSAVGLFVSPYFPTRKVLFGSVLVLLGGTILARIGTEIVQKFEVAPNEIVKETPYLKHAIEFTRKAYGITDVQELEFDPQENLTTEALHRNDLTVKNIRLWEHAPLLTTYSQLQEIRTYYDFLDADNDRYWINGEYRQVMLSVRELNPESLPSRIWINEHLVFTHGYGICLGPVNRISREGLPEFFIQDIPPVSSTDLKVSRPQIYFGEAKANYAIVNTQAREFDYPAGDENVYTDYGGSGGVPIKNFFRRILFSIRFGEFKILFSGDIQPQSRVLYYRSIKERLAKAAPFLKFDQDPYIVVDGEGKLFWMVDAYTLSQRYPYSERTAGFNYIRNAVKATIDAYNGTVRLYIFEPQDPVIQTYRKIFPELFYSAEEMPQDLRSHIRYPHTLMNIQSRIYATYHMTDPQVFYNKEDLWKIPVRTAGGRAEQMEPYYTIMKLAGIGKKEEFILMVPFTPAKKENMIAWMAARCDEPNYGKLLVYNFPKQKLVYGPQQIESRIDQEAEISKQLTLWNQGGSRVFRGNLLVIPVDQSLLYIQPLYLEATGGGLPELKRIIVAYGNAIAMEENLELSLARIFGGSMRMEKEAASSRAEKRTDIRSLAQRAKEHFERAQRAARQGDWAGYGAELKSLEQILKQLSELQ